MGQESSGEQEELLPGVPAPRKGAAEAPRRGAECRGLGLPQIVVAEVGQVFGSFPVGFAGRKVLRDHLGDLVLVDERRIFLGAEGDGIGPLEIEIGDVGDEDQMTDILHLKKRPDRIFPQLPLREAESIFYDQFPASELIPCRIDKQSSGVEEEIPDFFLRLILGLLPGENLRQIRVQQVREGHMCGIHHLDARVGQDGGYQVFDAVVGEHVVAVDIEDIVARGGIRARISCRGEAPVLFVMQDAEADVSLVGGDHPLADGDAVVGRSIVHQDALETIVGLRHHRLEAALHVWRHLIDGNDNGYGWVFFHTSR